ncbi:MAG TPA: hypothetical protein VF406_10580 [Thermodesulfobacteriota bacterium]
MRDTSAIRSVPVWSARRAGLAFVAGFVSVLIFHQLMFALLYAVGLVQAAPYNLQPVPPFGVPAVLSAAFWGGVWGIVFALVEPRFPRGPGYWVAAVLFGAVALTVVFWFVVAPLKGLPVGGGWRAAAWVPGLLVNGAWGLGTALLLRAFARPAR